SVVMVERFGASEPGAWVEFMSPQRRRGRAVVRRVPAAQRRRTACRLHRSVRKEAAQRVDLTRPPRSLPGTRRHRRSLPDVDVLTTANVLADLKADGPWMFDLLKERLGLEAAKRLIEPRPIDDWTLPLGANSIEAVEFGAGEAKHHACFHLADR